MFARNCPICHKSIVHKDSTNRIKNASVKPTSPCKSCATKIVHRKNPNKLIGKNNPMFGKSWKKIWSDKLTSQQFEEKITAYKLLKSRQTSGSSNPMFGRPSPIKSGRGRSGRWLGTYFRSLLELAFLEKQYEENGILPKSAETKELSVKLLDGRTYFPDFIDGNGTIWEIKPTRLLNSNEHKFIKAREKYGEHFKVITERELPNYATIHKRLDQFIDLHLD